MQTTRAGGSRGSPCAETRSKTRTLTPNTVSATAPSKAANTVNCLKRNSATKKAQNNWEPKQESKLRHAVLCWKRPWRSLKAHQDHFDQVLWSLVNARSRHHFTPAELCLNGAVTFWTAAKAAAPAQTALLSPKGHSWGHLCHTTTPSWQGKRLQDHRKQDQRTEWKVTLFS